MEGQGYVCNIFWLECNFLRKSCGPYGFKNNLGAKKKETINRKHTNVLLTAPVGQSSQGRTPQPSQGKTGQNGDLTVEFNRKRLVCPRDGPNLSQGGVLAAKNSQRKNRSDHDGRKWARNHQKPQGFSLHRLENWGQAEIAGSSQRPRSQVGADARFRGRSDHGASLRAGPRLSLGRFGPDTVPHKIFMFIDPNNVLKPQITFGEP